MSGMTEAKNTIVRTWSATATSAGAGDYSRYFADALLPQLRGLAGFAGAYLLRRDLDGEGIVHLTACTFWKSAGAIRAFAGNDITRCRSWNRKHRRCCWTLTAPRSTTVWWSTPAVDGAGQPSRRMRPRVFSARLRRPLFIQQARVRSDMSFGRAESGNGIMG